MRHRAASDVIGGLLLTKTTRLTQKSHLPKAPLISTDDLPVCKPELLR
jgi:hypothetical protein